MADALTRKDLLVTAGVGGAAVATIGGTLVALGLNQTTAPGEVVLRSVAGGGRPSARPDDGAWADAPEVRVPLLPQQLVPPALDAAGLSPSSPSACSTTARRSASCSPGRTRCSTTSTGSRRYHDAVAVMLPTRPGPAPAITMGGPGAPVHILQWRATWQRDLDGKTGVDQIYPRVVHDVMPDDILPPEVADEYWVGRKAGNPLSQNRRTTPVEQVVAEGFGTTTHLSLADAEGTGEHDGRGWKVAITVPRARQDAGAALEAGREWHVAFAVWLGHRENRGGRKHYTAWVPLRIEGA